MWCFQPGGGADSDDPAAASNAEPEAEFPELPGHAHSMVFEFCVELQVLRAADPLLCFADLSFCQAGAAGVDVPDIDVTELDGDDDDLESATVDEKSLMVRYLTLVQKRLRKELNKMTPLPASESPWLLQLLRSNSWWLRAEKAKFVLSKLGWPPEIERSEFVEGESICAPLSHYMLR